MSQDKTAFLSVSDKTGIVEFANGLSELGYSLLSSGGTASVLKQAELEVSEVPELTEFPDILSGRVRLLHPKLFAGILADPGDPKHGADLRRHGIPPLHIVVVNLYPLSEVLQPGNLSQEEVLEFLDVAGSALLRSAARNFPHVLTLCDPRDYPSVLEALKEKGGVSRERSRALAAKAFYYISYYDSTVAQYLSTATERLAEEKVMGLKKAVDLPYGENPHQRAALYKLSGARAWGLNAAQLVSGRPLNFNHYLGVDRACDLVSEFASPACAIVRHANPAGCASSERPAEAARLAYRSDPQGCTGGVAAFNRAVDEETARMDALRLAAAKSQERHPILSPDLPVVLAADGPLGPQHVKEAAAHGVSALIQPGGSSDDREAVRACDELNLAMLFTGVRHYRH